MVEAFATNAKVQRILCNAYDGTQVHKFRRDVGTAGIIPEWREYGRGSSLTAIAQYW